MNKFVKMLAIVSAIAAPLSIQAVDFVADTALTGAITTGTTIFGTAAALGVLMLVWTIGKKALHRGAK